MSNQHNLSEVEPMNASAMNEVSLWIRTVRSGFYDSYKVMMPPGVLLAHLQDEYPSLTHEDLEALERAWLVDLSQPPHYLLEEREAPELQHTLTPLTNTASP